MIGAHNWTRAPGPGVCERITHDLYAAGGSSAGLRLCTCATPWSVMQLSNCRKVAIPLPDGMTWDAFLQQASCSCRLLQVTPACSFQQISPLGTGRHAHGPASVADAFAAFATSFAALTSVAAPTSADWGHLHAHRCRPSCGWSEWTASAWHWWATTLCLARGTCKTTAKPQWQSHMRARRGFHQHGLWGQRP